MSKSSDFNSSARMCLSDYERCNTLNKRYELFNGITTENSKRYADFELERKRGFYVRMKSLMNLDKLLVDFETNFTRLGGKILWANDASDAKQMIYDVISSKKNEKIVKTRSNAIEEIGLYSFLESKKIHIDEINIGDFICGLTNERPFDMHSSSSHKTSVDVASTYTEKFGVREGLKTNQLVACTRKILSENILKADVVITGCDFLCADTGSIAVTDNDGAFLKSLSFASTHIVVVGIDKVISSVESLGLLWPLSSVYEIGKDISSYYSLISGKVSDDANLYVVLLDNGRSSVLKKEKQHQILACVECGACANVCPVFSSIGGHVYQTAYPGPVGTVVNPIVKEISESDHFLSLCTLCGRCNEVCPMNIPIKDLILQNRRDFVPSNSEFMSERNTYKFIINCLENRKSMDSRSFFKNFELKHLLKKTWCTNHEMPVFAPKSFSQQYRENLMENV